MKNEKVGSQLLEKGQLQKQMILISLNKIQAFKILAEVRSIIFQNIYILIYISIVTLKPLGELQLIETHRCYCSH